MSSIKAINYLKDTWLTLGVTLFLLVLVETFFSIAFLVKDNLIPSGSLDRLSGPEDYRDASWADEYYEEMAKNSVRWESYIYWRRKPYKGKYINIDSEGKRYTSNSQRTSNKEPLKIFMFGGSTMWGTNARDAFTIPSIVAKTLEGRGMSVETINFGETGYVSTQEVISLLLQLRKGNIPDVAIFYDGVNDTYSAYQNQFAGIPQNESNREKEFNLLNPERLHDLKKSSVRGALNELSTVRFVKKLLLRLNLRKETKSMLQDDKSDDKDSLAEQVIINYLGNMAIIKALAKSYGFRCVFYWQPTIFEKKDLSDYEQHVYGGQEEQDITNFYKKVYDVMRKTGSLRDDNTFHDISNIFADFQEPVYVDWFHLTERGNNRIAQAMAEDLFPILKSRRH